MKFNKFVGFGLSVVVAISASGSAFAQAKPWFDPTLEELVLSRFMGPKERLGRLLFNDRNLSEPAGQSCASCHDVATAGSDPDHNVPTSQGVNKRLFGNRNTPTANYMAHSPAFHFDDEKGLYVGGQFWDGRAATLEDQAKGPFLNPVEMANPSKQSVVDKVQGGAYGYLFKRVYGRDAFDDTEAAYNAIADAIAAYERTRSFNKFTSKYDAFLAGKAKLTAQEQRGMALFTRADKGNCAACHTLDAAADGTPPLLTDFTYDNLGVPKNARNPFYSLPAKFNPSGRNFVDLGLGGALGKSEHNGKFKVPTLRNIALTGPYMHNGYFTTLKGVVDFYNTRDVKPACRDPLTTDDRAQALNCWPAPEVKDNMNTAEMGNLRLKDSEVNDIVAFMHTLTDGWFSVFAQ